MLACKYWFIFKTEGMVASKMFVSIISKWVFILVSCGSTSVFCNGDQRWKVQFVRTRTSHAVVPLALLLLLIGYRGSLLRYYWRKIAANRTCNVSSTEILARILFCPLLYKFLFLF